MTNPLGTKGILIRKYANFIKNMWYGTSPVFSPWGLKNAISDFHSMVFLSFALVYFVSSRVTTNMMLQNWFNSCLMDSMKISIELRTNK